MQRLLRIGLVSLVVVVAVAAVGLRAALATLHAGEAAPPFSADATLGTHEFRFDLKAALAKGPVVLYFYPAAFTTGCTIEAHMFAGAIEKFHAAGAAVIGISGDDIGKLKKFGTSECRSKFPVAADPGLKIAKSYSAVLTSAYANRTSYVIAPDGTIAYAYTNLDPAKHVENTLAAVKELTKK